MYIYCIYVYTVCIHIQYICMYVLSGVFFCLNENKIEKLGNLGKNFSINSVV